MSLAAKSRYYSELESIVAKHRSWVLSDDKISAAEELTEEQEQLEGDEGRASLAFGSRETLRVERRGIVLYKRVVVIFL